jgi:hypothetical protein
VPARKVLDESFQKLLRQPGVGVEEDNDLAEALRPPRFLPFATGRFPCKIRTPENPRATATVLSCEPASTRITSCGLLLWRAMSPNR